MVKEFLFKIDPRATSRRESAPLSFGAQPILLFDPVACYLRSEPCLFTWVGLRT